MSLIIRKKGQPILEELGLGELSVTINSNKYLTIVGGCGQPFITLSSIKFSRLNPTEEEIDFGIELLEKFLKQNHSEIKAAVETRKVFKKFKEPKLPKYSSQDYKIGCTYSTKNNKRTVTNTSMTIGNNIVCYYNPEINKFSIGGYITEDALQGVINNLKDLKEITDKYNKELNSYEDSRLEVKKLQDELNKCVF